ncbi:MAG: RdgB/HAM1 family non-canonical purine NTP pyrophosphatase [Acidobacteria bacterium]|nr:RdgB/HAM1 family non-canonical purine NTP pyrophosphatase [Acidobacteriota bacterium]MBI3280725.1 RdgB/HAM1 family non-canonical purine NTP pyrophosphatase [Acidobacteriota bacterium]
MIVYCATTNPGKLREFRKAGSTRVHIEPLPGLAGIAPLEETGPGFEENAVHKAVYYSGFTPAYLFADDSGLAVEALGGAPGVYSARYAGPNATDEDNNRLLLERMRGVANRRAAFVCVIALARAGELVRTFRGEVKGELLEEPRGSNGFGYDPLFYYPPFRCTFGQAPPDAKQQASHRGQALRQMVAFLGSLSGG